LGVTQAFHDFVEINYISAASTTRQFDYIDFGFDFGVDDTDRDGVADSGAAPFRRQKPETGAGLVTFIENTHAVAFAFAFDYDNNAVDTDGLLDTSPNGNVIWAFDSDGADTDGDGILELDTILDTNDDGVINAADTPGGDDITNVGGAVAWTTTVVPLDHIRAIRVWLLVRSDSPIRGHTENTTYVVGARRVIPNDNFRRRMLSTVIKCPNLW
jgi:type IV pilus assembly protein PilW